jgi:hypothetical protein
LRARFISGRASVSKWVYESGFANFYQGLSPEQIVEGSAVSCAVAWAVLGTDEWRALAGGRGGFAVASGEGGVNDRGLRTRRTAGRNIEILPDGSTGNHFCYSGLPASSGKKFETPGPGILRIEQVMPCSARAGSSVPGCFIVEPKAVVPDFAAL